MEEFKVEDFKLEVFNSIIIGSGAAGLNCAIHLVKEGISSEKIAIITENLGGGTSFNAGSDKQTYYKMSLVGKQSDSPYEMAKALFNGGGMHGDIALVEATNSIREFFHLLELGVPFPHDKYGAYVGYKTDNDPRQRATSIGPFTSQEMCNCLLKAVKKENIKIFDKYYAAKIVVEESNNKSEAIGLICLNINNLSQSIGKRNLLDSIIVFKARNIIVATGGPAFLYKHSVYPKSQHGSSILAIEAGCKFRNLTESQFGLASVDFRWNVSGSYQQVIPRYVSIDDNNDEYEFLRNYFPNFTTLSKAIFLKGYQWPFSSERIINHGSSIIDLAVYYEIEYLGRKVFLDYNSNPLDFNFEDLDPIPLEYLLNSGALVNIPIERLKKLNPEAIDLYRTQGIDITEEPLRIAVCNQHLNGGVACDIWWESTSVNHIFAIGEISGSHGIHRPGGSALNAGQVGGLRAAQKIYHSYRDLNTMNHKQFLKTTQNALNNFIATISSLIRPKGNEVLNRLLKPSEILVQIQNRMSNYGSFVRPLKGLEIEIDKLQKELMNYEKLVYIGKNSEIIKYLRVKDALLTHFMILKSILNYHKLNGRSRGSYLIIRDELKDSIGEELISLPGDLNCFNYISSNLNLSGKIQTIQLQKGKTLIEWVKIKEIPSDFGWFENIWKDFSDGSVFK
jgi:succinate dehydrogenase/fumarate reductase flavoprotein subunit